VEAETMAIWNLGHLLGRWPEMVFDQHVWHARCFSNLARISAAIHIS